MPTGSAPANRNVLVPTSYQADPRSWDPVGASPGPENITLDVAILTPKFASGRFPYRDNVTARVTYNPRGRMPRPFGGVVLGPASADASQLVLVCDAVCRSCASQASSPYRKCNPTRFQLDPVPSRRNRGLELDESSGTLSGEATFKIRPRRKRPRPEDQEWRCPSESLM